MLYIWQLHAILHFTDAAAGAPPYAQLLGSSHGNCMSEILTVAHAAASAAAAAVGCVHVDRRIRQSTAYTPGWIISTAGKCHSRPP
jgi:hypothetical protein